ncbi:MAG: repressor LexA [Gammaproteobacteria bacterium]|nr:repressor LexA [Gammaproteobacteria bacterium]
MFLLEEKRSPHVPPVNTAEPSPSVQLTRRQEAIYRLLVNRRASGDCPPTLGDLCTAFGLKSRGSMHLHVKALVKAGLVDPPNGQRRSIRLTSAKLERVTELPLLGTIVAGALIEAAAVTERIPVPDYLQTSGDCYVLRVRGDSMIDEGIIDGDLVVVEHRDRANEGEIVVALIDGAATLQRLSREDNEGILAPANRSMKSMRVSPQNLNIQGVVVGQMRCYRDFRRSAGSTLSTI